MQRRMYTEPGKPTPCKTPSRLPRLVWLLWSLLVVGTGYMSWRFDANAGRPANMVGMTIHCTLAGMVGLLILTWIEIRLSSGFDF